MTLWNDKTAAEATGGKAQGSWEAGRVEIDSRRVQKGDLFVALGGERFDGHDFLDDAFKKGASAAMVSHAPGGIKAPLLVVDDTLSGLVALAQYNRKRAPAKIVGVTGSVGKTSVKEMIKLALAAHGETYAGSGNFNNHIGMPLMLANMPVSAKFGVFEMGMNHAGEIAHLTKMVRPNIAVITNVEAVHLEFFDSVEKIADAKAEIFEGMEKGGVAVLNADNVHFPQLKKVAEKRGAKVVACGEKGDCRLMEYRATAQGSALKVNIAGKQISLTLAATGKHWAAAVLMALAVVQALKLDVEKSASALAAFSEPEGRGRSVALHGATLIDDSYNASPVSMKAAFAKTAELWEAKGKSGRKIALLGDMLELGTQSAALHAALAADLRSSKFDAVFTAGEAMKALHDALPPEMKGGHVAKAMDLLPIILREIRAGDVILIKGSHGSHMVELAKALKETKPNPGEKKHAV